MKNNDAKANGRLKNVLAMILAVTIVIGLMSSTAIKLVTATYLMQNSRKKITTGNQFVDDFLNNVIDDGSTNTDTNNNNNTDSNSGSTSDSGSSSSSSSDTQTTTKEETTKEETTKAPETEKQEEVEETVQSVKDKQEILKSYVDVVTLAKTKKPADFVKTTTRTVKSDFLTSFLWGNIAKANPDYFTTVVYGLGEEKDLCIDDELTGCLIDAAVRDEVSESVKSASREELADGSIKVVIEFNDEENPKPVTDKKANSFTSKAFPVMDANTFRVMIDESQSSKTEEVSIKYTGCTIEAIYNPKTGEISYIKQTAKYEANAVDGYKKTTYTVTEVSEYTEFKY